MTIHKFTTIAAILLTSTAPIAIHTDGVNTAPAQPIVLRNLGFSGQALALNDHGQVVGTMTGRTAAVFWSDATGPIVIPPLPGDVGAVATGINNRAEVVGYSILANGVDAHPFIWSLTEGIRDLGHGGAYAINDRGTIVGADPIVLGRARLWRPDGTVVDLGTLGSIWSEAHAINHRGQAVGYGWAPNGDTHGLIWSPAGAIADMGFVGWAFAVNDRGNAFTRGANARPAFWTPAVGLASIATPGCHSNWSGGVNGMDWVVSTWSTCSGREQMHAFVWGADIGLIDLFNHVTTEIVDYDTWAWDVNEEGVVAGAVIDPAIGLEHAVIWQLPVSREARLRSLETAIADVDEGDARSSNAARQLRSRLDDVKAAFATGDRRSAEHAIDKLRQKLASDLRSRKLADADSWLLDSVTRLSTQP